ncbi:MAG: polymerase III subunit beta protein [Candidatus Woesebacteria bacterium GW2011_GWA2_44_33]|uniref:Beta sliding clamp n=1 Tax=Candidatus Woesebacteria bacterium GW2011_GWA2_44_33 TaxID=1618564 RepID=A0A0G1IZR9_9BACT|nr:MAG: polymerase III subunit beta protein [Candidatus Woesebacteria bacterium GW2011_GWA2_44_33]
MKASVLQENFSKSLSLASRFINTRTQLPVLGNILLVAKKTRLLVSSTNLEVSVACSIGASVEKEGEITVPGRTITDLVINLPAEKITLEVEKEQLKIHTPTFESTLSGMNASDFPPVPNSVSKDGAIVLPKESFLNALSQVIFAASIDETRPILTGVLFVFQKDQLILVATDGFRLNKKENQVLFGTHGVVLSSRVLEGEFPDYEKIIPKAGGTKILTDKEEFLRAVKLSSVFAREAANIVKINLGKDFLDVSAESSTSGSQKTRVDARVEGETKLEIAFNYRFLEEFLHAVKAEEINMELSGPSSPGVFKDPTDPAFLHLIMPVRVQG